MNTNKKNNIRIVLTALVLVVGGYYIQQISEPYKITSDSKILPRTASADVPAPPSGK
jgi:hypothetical protein